MADTLCLGRWVRNVSGDEIEVAAVAKLELVVVFTAGNYGQGSIWRRFRDQIVPQEIIPAIRR